MLGRPGLGDERSAAGPLAAHAEAKQDAEDGELHEVLRETARGGEDGVDQDACHQGAGAAEAVGDDAEEKSTCGCGKQRDRAEDSGGAFAEVQVGHQRSQHQGVEHYVEGVEHPAEGCCD